MIKKNMRFTLVLSLITLLLSCADEEELILNETFDKNTRGWFEETSEYHSLFIENGKYYIESKDTSSSIYRSSSTSLDKSYLLGLPEKFDIEAKFQLQSFNLDDAHFGLLLNGATIEYSFNFYKSGIVEVLEHNYNSKTTYILFSDTSDYELEDDIKANILIDSIDFKLFIDDYEIGQSEFSVKSWQELRLFTSKQSKVAVDYVTIKEVKQ